jgi:hypothetical protein
MTPRLGLTHVSADRDYLVAVEVTDREHPVEVGQLSRGLCWHITHPPLNINFLYKIT